MKNNETLDEYTIAAKNVVSFLKETIDYTETQDDKTFRKNTTNQISKRDSKYTELLEHFVSITKVRNILKEIFKWLFYLVIIIAIGVLSKVIYSLFDRYLSSATLEQILDSMPLLMTSMVGFVSTIIAIPVTITKYLFSTKEDENITKIILHTQDHDTSGRRWAMKTKLQKNESNADKEDTA